MNTENNYFEILNAINVNDHTEKKNNLTYLTWTWAWAEVKKQYPNAKYKIKKFENNLPYVYDPNTGYMVFTEVTIGDLTYEMWLPVMDSANKAMKSKEYEYKVISYKKENYGEEITKKVQAATMFDINKTIMRCLVKNLAMFGLGLYIYSGEDLPEEEATKKASEEQVNQIKEMLDEKRIPNMLKYYKIEKIEDILEKDAKELIGRLTK